MREHINHPLTQSWHPTMHPTWVSRIKKIRIMIAGWLVFLPLNNVDVNDTI